jgi:hypothetical protein
MRPNHHIMLCGYGGCVAPESAPVDGGSVCGAQNRTELGAGEGKPETVIAWHRKSFRLFWTWKVRRGQPGRPAVSQDVRKLIRRLSRENPLWGAPRIHGELLKLGIDVGETSVGKYMPAIANHRRNVAGLPRKPHQDHGLGGLLYCADDPIPSAVRVSGAGSRPAPHCPFQRDRPPHRRMDCPAIARGPFPSTRSRVTC